MRRYAVCLTVGLLFPPGTGAVEEAVKDVRFLTQGDQVHVFYALAGEGRYEVSLQLSNDGGRTFLRPPRSLSGDVGSGVEPGRNKRVVWDVLKDVTRLEGDAFVFQVTARRPGKGLGKKWLLGLAAAGGGASVYALQRGEDILLPTDDENAVTLEIPDPEEVD